MRRLCVIVPAVIGLVGCGGSPDRGQPAAAPPASAAPPAAAAASAPEPIRRLPPPSAADLHGAAGPTIEELGELYDISRDLLGLASRDPSASGDLADDLNRFAGKGLGRAEVEAFAGSLATGLAGRALDADAAGQLSVLLYVAMNADTLTGSQRTAAMGELRARLAGAGVPADQAQTIGAHVERLAGPSARRRG